MSRVTILCYDLSSNALGRSLVLAKIISPFSSVRIIGLQSRPKVWLPALDAQIDILPYPAGAPQNRPAHIEWLREQVAGERLIVSKAQWESLGLVYDAELSLANTWVDIDDFETSFIQSRGRRNPALWIWPRYLLGYLRTVKVDGVARSLRSDTSLVTVANTWLQHRYGGELLYHVRDPKDFEPVSGPARFLPNEQRGHRAWVGFVGTIRPHKGVQDLVEALSSLHGDEAPGLFLAGVNKKDPFVDRLLAWAHQKLTAARLCVVDEFSASNLSDILAAPDILVIPSRPSDSAKGQIPAKLFDALFAGKPVIASELGDTPQVLDGCGMIYTPGDIAGLRTCILKLTADPEHRKQIGRAARAKAKQLFSVEAAGPLVVRYLDRLSPMVIG